jgi:hypothetical protein
LRCSGDVPDEVVGLCAGLEFCADTIWDDIRKILKNNPVINICTWDAKHCMIVNTTVIGRKYYNRIPLIVWKLGFGKGIIWDSTKYKDIVQDFKDMNFVFCTTGKRTKWNRRYFPNLRFIALKLMEKHGAVFSFKIPFIRTKRKKKVLGDLWDDLLM